MLRAELATAQEELAVQLTAAREVATAQQHEQEIADTTEAGAQTAPPQLLGSPMRRCLTVAPQDGGLGDPTRGEKEGTETTGGDEGEVDPFCDLFKRVFKTCGTALRCDNWVHRVL